AARVGHESPAVGMGKENVRGRAAFDPFETERVASPKRVKSSERKRSLGMHGQRDIIFVVNRLTHVRTLIFSRIAARRLERFSPQAKPRQHRTGRAAPLLVY